MLELFPRARRSSTAPPAFLAGGGDMGERIRAFDWAQTDLGVPATWPAALQVAVHQVLATPQPMAILWGPGRATLVNDACLPLLGEQAGVLGMPLAAAWPELWPQVAGCVERCAEGAGWTAGPVMLAVDRDGMQVEGHYRIVAAPLVDAAGAAQGFLCTFVEATAEVLAARELGLLEALGAARHGVGSIEAACHAALRALARDAADMPFCGLYVLDSARGQAELVACSGIEAGHPLMPATLAPGRDAPYPLARALSTDKPVRAALPEGNSGAVPCGPWSHPPREVVAAVLGGVIWVAALNPFRRWDGGHARLLDLVAGQLRAMMGAAEASGRYRQLVEALPAAVYTTDSDGRIVLYNQATLAIWGREPSRERDRFSGAHLVFTPEGERVPLERCPVARVLAGEAVEARQELVIERPDGSVCHVIANPSPILDAGGRIVGAMDMLIDITARKLEEAELAQTKDALASQVEGLAMLHGLALRLAEITEEKPAIEAVLRTAVAAQGGSSGFIWLHDAASGDLVVEASVGFEGERAGLFSRVTPGRDGGGAGNAFAQKRRWVVADTEADALFEPFRDVARAAGFRAVHSTPIVTRSGALLGVLSVHFARRHAPSQRDQQVADLCARHAADAIEALRSQEALRESERLYRAIGESIDYGVWLADAEGRNTYTSDSFLKLLGVPHEQWAGSGWRDIVHPDDMPGLVERWRHCIATGEQLDHEFRVRCADGGWRTILGRGVPVRNERGAIVSWAGINLDIERLKQVENDLREHDRRKDEFLATLAHELRNPLAPLRNGLEVLRLAHGNAEMTHKARGMMERQLGQMVRLIDDLLDVSRVSRGKIELRREAVELATVLRNAVETSQPLINERGHDLAVSVPPESIRVDADVTRLSQVFWNLLNNAAKYTEPGGRIDLRVHAGEGKVAVSIRDNGIGIPPEMQSRVFDIFTQVDRSLEKSQGGLGIGLSIAKRLVEMHGGTIKVTSEGHRKGSEFVVTLPAALAAKARDVGSDTGPHAVPGGPSRRILVADDNTDSATTLSLMLEVLGNQVRVAHDGEEAFAAASEFRPDVILLDIGMPKMNGYGACEMIRAQPWGREPYIVALTGWGQDEDKTRSREAGFDRHLVKPVEPAMLERIIRSLPLPASRAS